MTLRIEIELDNAAFDGGALGRNGTEVARILRKLADEQDGCYIVPDEPRTLRDINGNTVGFACASESAALRKAGVA